MTAETGLVLGRMLAAQDQILKLHDRQIMLLERIEYRLAHMPVALAEKVAKSEPDKKPDRSVNYTELMLNIRSTAYALLPIAIIALVIAGKLSILEGVGIFRQVILGPAAGQ